MRHLPNRMKWILSLYFPVVNQPKHPGDSSPLNLPLIEQNAEAEELDNTIPRRGFTRRKDSFENMLFVRRFFLWKLDFERAFYK
jgi:hypothetical protein